MDKNTFVVIRRRGPAWVAGKTMREQEGWPEHAQFMNQLAAEGFVLLGGPLADTGEILLIVEAESEAEVRERLYDDSWSVSGLLVVQSVRLWNILLVSQQKQ
ncbi:MAG: hypothetical protein HYZ49_09530 [Chloroflexi bacterium]|nr:hypothetical protein [Chloroflexota bacterium]